LKVCGISPGWEAKAGSKGEERGIRFIMFKVAANGWCYQWAGELAKKLSDAESDVGTESLAAGATSQPSGACGVSLLVTYLPVL
jgi:hypothetical protein